MDSKKSSSPRIAIKPVMIGDDFIIKNYTGTVDIKNKRVYGGGFGLPKGAAFCEQNLIVIYRYDIDSRLSLLNAEEKIKLRQYVDDVNSEDINAAIAHESQHIRNYRAGGYNYIANSGNIYECMILALADEQSAMLAGYFYKYKNVDKAIDAMVDAFSPEVIRGYVNGQFLNNFKRLKQYYERLGWDTKKLYEKKFYSSNINRVLDFYFTIDGQKIMYTMSKKSQMKFSKLMLETKKEINQCIDSYVAQQKSANHMISGNNKGYSY